MKRTDLPHSVRVSARGSAAIRSVAKLRHTASWRTDPQSVRLRSHRRAVRLPAAPLVQLVGARPTILIHCRVDSRHPASVSLVPCVVP